jgi:hypothetical protein
MAANVRMVWLGMVAGQGLGRDTVDMTSDLFERRRLEVFLSIATGGFGMFLLLPMESMATPAFTFITADIPEPTWGLAFLLNGTAHGLALAVNGSRWWSPLIRCWAALYSLILYAILTLGFWAFSPATTAVWTYGCLSFGSGIAVFWAWRDAVKAVRVHNAIAHHT